MEGHLERNRREMGITRAKVQEGLLEAVEMAQANGDAGSMHAYPVYP